MNNSTQNTAEKGEKLFTAKQVERIVGERLARERRNGTALGKVRDLIMGLAEKGVLTSRNIPDMAAELEKMLAHSEFGTAEDTEKANTDEVGASPTRNFSITQRQGSDALRLFTQVFSRSVRKETAVTNVTEAMRSAEDLRQPVSPRARAVRRTTPRFSRRRRLQLREIPA